MLIMSATIKICDVFKQWLTRKDAICLSIRHISSSNFYLNKYGTREARFLNKIMGNKNIGRKPWFRSEESLSASPFPKTGSSKGGQNQRRIAVLNKLFMRHISDMMSTSGVAKEIVGRGLEISRVKTAPDFNRINVFWLAKGTEDDVEIEHILQNYSWQLRHELSQLRVIGIVPPIYFVKDKEYSKTVEVNRILARADFGEEYVPVDVGYRLKSEFSQTAEQSPEILSQNKALEGNELENEILNLPLPPMRNDVLGLKHAEMMTKIKKGMKKAKALHRQTSHHVTTSVEDNEMAESIVNTTIDSKRNESTVHLNINPKKEEFTKFLMKRQFEKKKMHRGKKNYTPEMELYETEVLENSQVAAEFMENIDVDKDFLYDEHKHRT